MTYVAYVSSGEEVGPCTISDLQRLAKAGILKPTDRITDEEGNPVSASDLKIEFPDPNSAPTAEPEPAPPAPASFYELPKQPKILPAGAMFAVVAVSLAIGCLILGAIFYPVFATAGSGSIEKRKQMGHMKELSRGIMIYVVDHNDRFPPSMTSMLALKEAMRKPESYRYESSNPAGKEFQTNPFLGGAKLGDIKDPSRTMMYFDSQPWPNSKDRYVAFVDGSVRKLSDQEIKDSAGNKFVLR